MYNAYNPASTNVHWLHFPRHVAIICTSRLHCVVLYFSPHKGSVCWLWAPRLWFVMRVSMSGDKPELCLLWSPWRECTWPLTSALPVFGGLLFVRKLHIFWAFSSFTSKKFSQREFKSSLYMGLSWTIPYSTADSKIHIRNVFCEIIQCNVNILDCSKFVIQFTAVLVCPFVATTTNFYWKHSITPDNNHEGEDAALCRFYKSKITPVF